MPIEIMEMVIKAQVSTTEATDDNATTTATDPKKAARYQLLEKAVQQAVDIIKRKNER